MDHEDNPDFQRTPTTYEEELLDEVDRLERKLEEIRRVATSPLAEEGGDGDAHKYALARINTLRGIADNALTDG